MMKWLVPIFLLFFFSCTEDKTDAAKLKDGLYLVADSASNPLLSLLNYDSSQTIGIADTVAVFDQKILRNLQRNFLKNTTEYQISFSDQDWTKLVFLQYKKPSQKLALVFEGRIVGTWTIPADTVRVAPGFPVADYTKLERLNNFCDSLQNFGSPKKIVSGRKPETYVGKSFYENGKIYSETKIEGHLLCSRTYYENGDPAIISIRDTNNFTNNPDSSYYLLMLPGNRRVSETINKGILLYSIREYYGNGKLKTEWSDYQTAHQSPMLIRNYDYEGNLVYEERAELLTVCGMEAEFNHPQVIRVHAYTAGTPLFSGNLFSSCGPACEADSIGTWEFFEGGKPVSQRKFISQEARYSQYCRDAKQYP